MGLYALLKATAGGVATKVQAHRKDGSSYMTTVYMKPGEASKVDAHIKAAKESPIAKELEKYLINNSDLYHQKFVPILRNLQHKFATGKIDFEQAVNVVWHYVDSGSDAMEDKGHAKFDETIKKALAVKLTDEIIKKLRSGEHQLAKADDLLGRLITLALSDGEDNELLKAMRSKMRVMVTLDNNEVVQGITIGERDGFVRVLHADSDGLPSIAVVEPEDVIPAMFDNPLLERWAGSLTSMQPMDLQKAAPPGTVAVTVQVKGKRGTHPAIRYKKINPDGSSSNVEVAKPKRGPSDKQVRVGAGSQWYRKLMPDETTYGKMQLGDGNALAQYLQDHFWNSAQTEQKQRTNSYAGDMITAKQEGSYTTANPIIAAYAKGTGYGDTSAVLSRPYDMEDMIQETALKMLELQRQGSLNNVPRDKFPSYLISVFRNMGRNLQRQNKVGREIATAIEDFTNMVASSPDAVESGYIHAEDRGRVTNAVGTIFDRVSQALSGSKNPKAKEIFRLYLEQKTGQQIAQEVGQKRGTVVSLLSRMTPNLKKIARQAGYTGKHSDLDFMADYQVLHGIRRPSRMAKAFKFVLAKAGFDTEYGWVERMKWNDLIICIENQYGSIRKGSWGETFMENAYGYFEGVPGSDGDDLDVFIGPMPSAPNVYVIRINDPVSGGYDEDKVFVGFESADDAKAAFYENYDEDADTLFRDMAEVPYHEFVNDCYQRMEGSVGEIDAESIVADRLVKTMLMKAKAVPVGTLSKDGKKKKAGDGQWVPVKGAGKGSGEEEEKPETGKEAPKTDDSVKKKAGEQSKKALFESIKESLKTAIKGILQGISDTYAGQGGEEAGSQAASESAQDLKAGGKKVSNIRDAAQEKVDDANAKAKKKPETKPEPKAS